MQNALSYKIYNRYNTMNIVYWLEFTKRLENKEPPYYYIGSKHKCSIQNGVIINTRGKEYWSSSKQIQFLNALAIEKPKVKILHVCEDVLIEEEFYHRHYDVAKSSLFFNKAIATGLYGGSGIKAPRYGMKNSDYVRKCVSKAQKGLPKSEEHKQSVSEGLKRFCEKDNKINNSRGKQVLKTWSESAKRRNQNPDNKHPRGMLGKKMPRENCLVCGKSISVNQIKRHTNNCKLNK